MESLSRVYRDITRVYLAGIQAVQPDTLVRQILKVDESTDVLHVKDKQYSLNRNVYVVGFGKAVLGIGMEIHSLLKKYITSGILSVPVGTLDMAYQINTEKIQSFIKESKIRVFEGAVNNLPDTNAEETAKAIYQLAYNADINDLIITLVSGGGSSLLPLPVDGVTLQEKRMAIECLLKSGATINEVNLIRQCLSKIKGGKLAMAAYPAQVVSLILSDIVGDPLEYIASGPTVLQTCDRQLLQAAIEKSMNIQLPQSVLKHLLQYEDGSSLDETNCNTFNTIIGNNAIATKEAVEVAKRIGYDSISWSHSIQGEAKDIGKFYAKLADTITNSNGQTIELQTLLTSLSISLPCEDIAILAQYLNRVAVKSNKLCLISSGEPTVTVTGSGQGGRNQELALSFAKHIQFSELKSVVAFCSVGTDGKDGPTDAAGAIVDSSTWRHALEQQLDPEMALLNNDSYNFFSMLSHGNHLIKTGLTGTNVMDIHILIVKL